MSNKKLTTNARVTAGDVLPYIAVFGIAAISIYAVTTVWKKVKEIDPFSDGFDFGNDPGLSSMFKKDYEQ